MATEAPSLADLARVARDHCDRLERELAEIDLLVQQARIEAARHEQKRGQVAERVEQATARGLDKTQDGRDVREQLLTATQRAALMQAQVEILEGKQKVLTRFRDAMSELCEGFAAQPFGSLEVSDNGSVSPEMSRAVHSAQEDLRKEISRQMHDGPAQSLTNIVLRAQIVERLMTRDPALAQAEVSELIDMVQQTLESTKTFIFDVRPMVLDDLGLVPTMRRAARDRARRTETPVVFESVGPDRRLAADVESGLFRVLDDAMAGYVSTRPARVTLRLDWTDDALRVRLAAERDEAAAEPVAVPAGPRPEDRRDMPPALAAMISEQRAGAEAATAAAATARARATALPPGAWSEIRQRASTIGLAVALSEDGRVLQAHLPFDR